MDLEIRVDRKVCIGSGQCVHFAPGVFTQGEDAISVVVDPRGEPEERIVQAVITCPVEAITLHVGGTTVGSRDLKDWMRGTHRHDAVVEELERLSIEHYELREAFTSSPTDPDTAAAEAVCALARDHLRDEDRVYAAITELIGPRLVGTFRDDHTRIEQALAAASAHVADPDQRGKVLGELVEALDDHIRLEETVLFPVALAALAKQPMPEVSTAP